MFCSCHDVSFKWRRLLESKRGKAGKPAKIVLNVDSWVQREASGGCTFIIRARKEATQPWKSVVKTFSSGIQERSGASLAGITSLSQDPEMQWWGTGICRNRSLWSLSTWSCSSVVGVTKHATFTLRRCYSLQTAPQQQKRCQTVCMHQHASALAFVLVRHAAFIQPTLLDDLPLTPWHPAAPASQCS